MPYTIIKLNPKTYQVQDKNTGKVSHLINKKRSDCFTVINTETGKVHARCTSLQNAKAQLRLLYGLESGDWKPSEKKGGQMYDSDDNEYDDQDEMDKGVGLYINPETPIVRSRKAKGVVRRQKVADDTKGVVEKQETPTESVKSSQPPPKKDTWKAFFSRHSKGKKFASQADTHEFMRKIGALWTAHKTQKKTEKELEIKARKAMRRKMKKQEKTT